MIPIAVAERARELRQHRRRTASGVRRAPWSWIASALALEGRGRFRGAELARAVAALPAATHPAAPPAPPDVSRLERAWRTGWECEFPGVPWPGIDEARRQIHGRIRKGARACQTA